MVCYLWLFYLFMCSLLRLFVYAACFPFFAYNYEEKES